MRRSNIFYGTLCTIIGLAALTVLAQGPPTNKGEIGEEGIPYTLNRVSLDVDYTMGYIFRGACSAYLVRPTKVLCGQSKYSGISACQVATVKCSVEKKIFGEGRSDIYLEYLKWNSWQPRQGPWYWVIPREGQGFIVVVPNYRQKNGKTPEQAILPEKVFPEMYEDLSIADTYKELYATAMGEKVEGAKRAAIQVFGKSSDIASITTKYKLFLGRTLASDNPVIREVGLQQLTDSVSFMATCDSGSKTQHLIASSLSAIMAHEDWYETDGIRNYLQRGVAVALNRGNLPVEEQTVSEMFRAIKDSGKRNEKSKQAVLRALLSRAQKKKLPPALIRQIEAEGARRMREEKVGSGSM